MDSKAILCAPEGVMRRCFASVVLIALSVSASPARAQPITIDEFPVPTANSGVFGGITAGPDGNVWFTEYFVHKIAKITPTGAITEFSGPIRFPGGIATGSDGNIWFTQINNPVDAIGRYTLAGNFATFQIPAYPAQPHSIVAGPDGNLWFTEFHVNGNQIGRITPSGVITEFPVPTAGSDLDGIVVGPDGNLWFTELLSNKIGRITPAGGITEFAIPGNGELHGITTGPDGNIWFTDIIGNSIGRLTLTGVVTEFPVPTPASQPSGITTAPDGNLWFTESATGKVARITPAGAITEFATPTPSSGPNSITVGADGNIWFTEFLSNKIGRVNLAPNGGAFMAAVPMLWGSGPILFSVLLAAAALVHIKQQRSCRLKGLSPHQLKEMHDNLESHKQRGVEVVEEYARWAICKSARCKLGLTRGSRRLAQALVGGVQCT